MKPLIHSNQPSENAMTKKTQSAEAVLNEQAEEMAAETMLGDLISALLDELKSAPDVWPKLSQAKQEEVIERLTRRVELNVRRAVNIISASGREVITADLEQVTVKDGIKAICTMSKFDPKRHALLDSVGKAVLLVVADAQAFLGGEIPEADPDQGDLIGDEPLAKAA